jgi:hypothetical protein
MAKRVKAISAYGTFESKIAKMADNGEIAGGMGKQAL